METIDFNPAIKVIAEAIPNYIAIYLYGSYAQGRERADSDIDLAVLAKTPIDSKILYLSLIHI